MLFNIWLLSLFAASCLAFDCSKLKDGMYPSDPTQCTDVFWKCYAGNAFRYTCPSELYYRADAEYCDYKDKVPNCREKPAAIEEKSEGNEFDCSGKSDGYHIRQQLFYCEAGKSAQKPLST